MSTRKKILVAEDEELLREILSLVLEDNNYAVDLAKNGAEAWELLQKNHYDLLATDLFMPEMNGVELVQKARQQFPQLKIMMISGGGKEILLDEKLKEISYRDQNARVDHFIAKPYAQADLLKAISQLLA